MTLWSRSWLRSTRRMSDRCDSLTLPLLLTQHCCVDIKQGAIPVVAQLCVANAKSKVMPRNLSATSLLINAQDLPQVCMHLLFGSLWPGEAESLWLTYLEDEMMRYALNEIMGSDYAADLHTLAFLFFLPE